MGSWWYLAFFLVYPDGFPASRETHLPHEYVWQCVLITHFFLAFPYEINP